MNIDDEWDLFENEDFDIYSLIKKEEKNTNSSNIPKASELYISTKTKITHYNQSFDLNYLFWKIPIIDYHEQNEGIIKKQIKINCLSKEESVKLNELIKNEKKYIYCSQILMIDKLTLYKDIRKINIGISSKDLLTLKNKKKGAFYNCFVLLVRIRIKKVFKEINVKLFNTGKLEIPGIQDENNLIQTLDLVIKILQPFVKKKITYLKKNIKNVLINSNFTCNYYINRNVLCSILKNKYLIDVIYDPCSYPGIQCKYYNNNYNDTGICNCEKKCKKKEGSCKEISFMIFRTGSILIVGNCSDELVNHIYYKIIDILNTEYLNIFVGNNFKKKKIKKKKYKKKVIIIT